MSRMSCMASLMFLLIFLLISGDSQHQQQSCSSQFSLKAAREIQEVILKLNNEWGDRKEFTLNDAFYLCQQIIEGPWNKVTIKPVEKEKLFQEKKETGPSGKEILVIEQLGGCLISTASNNYKILINNDDNLSQEVKIHYLFHEVGHLVDVTSFNEEELQSYYKRNFFKREVNAEVLAYVLKSIWLDIMPLEKKVAGRLLPDNSIGGESFMAHLVVELFFLRKEKHELTRSLNDENYRDTRPSELELTLESAREILAMSEKELQKIYFNE